MCMICNSVPCHPRCPNAPEQTPLMRCRECGGGIYADDKYFDAGDGCICWECMEEKSTEEILGLFGESLSVAAAY